MVAMLAEEWDAVRGHLSAAQSGMSLDDLWAASMDSMTADSWAATMVLERAAMRASAMVLTMETITVDN